MALETVAVLGGTGFVGTRVVERLSRRGYEVVAVDQADGEVVADALDAGEVYAVMARADADAVVHLATLPEPLSHAGHVTFESNATTTFNVLEAATDLGLEAAVLPSSINVLGWEFQDPAPDLAYLPVDEDHPLSPRDPYALGKLAVEVVGAGFGRRADAPDSIVSLRFPWIVDDEMLETHVRGADRSMDALRADWEADGFSDDLFSYLHVEDAARAVVRALESNVAGHEAFFLSAADTTADPPTARLVEAFHPDLECRRSFEGREALIDTSKARKRLGWQPELSWRDG